MGGSTGSKVRIKLSKWQKRFVIDGFDDPLRIAVTGIGSGKSRALAVWIVLQCMKKPGLRGIVMAQIYKTLSRVLVHEIEVVSSMVGLQYEYNKSTMEMIFPNGSTLFFYSGDNASGVLGLSQIDLLALDEAAFLSQDVYHFARDRMRGGKYRPMVRLISSPVNDQVENWFRELCTKYPDCVINAATYDNPFVSEEFINELKERYIEGSNLYKQQVQGLFLDTDAASQLVKRADFFPYHQEVVQPKYWMGCDFGAGVGCDYDVCAVIDSAGVSEIISDNDLNTQQKVAAIKILWDKYSPAYNYVDNTAGFGQGSIDLGREKNMTLNGVNFSAKPFNPDLYPNLRTEAYVELAKDIRNGFYIPEDVRPELLAQQITVDSRGRIALVSKDLVKQALGRSPDRADAIALANYARNHCNQPKDHYTEQEALDVVNRYMNAYFG